MIANGYAAYCANKINTILESLLHAPRGYRIYDYVLLSSSTDVTEKSAFISVVMHSRVITVKRSVYVMSVMHRESISRFIDKNIISVKTGTA